MCWAEGKSSALYMPRNKKPLTLTVDEDAFTDAEAAPESSGALVSLPASDDEAEISQSTCVRIKNIL